MNMKYIKLFENYNSNKYYHVSPTSKRDDITSSGLTISNDDKDQRYPNISEMNVIYAWEELSLANWYALTEARDYNTSFDIWGFNYNTTTTTEDTTIGIPYAVKISDNIPFDELELIDTITNTNTNKILDLDDILDDIEYS